MSKKNNKKRPNFEKGNRTPLQKVPSKISDLKDGRLGATLNSFQDGSFTTVNSEGTSWGEKFRRQKADEQTVDDDPEHFLSPSKNKLKKPPTEVSRGLTEVETSASPETGFKLLKMETGLSNGLTEVDTRVNVDSLSNLGSIPRRNEFDTQIFEWLNRCRTNPRSFIPFLEARLEMFEPSSKILKVSENERLMTKEGPRAVHEAITFLEKVNPCRDLKWNNVLSRACEDHVRECGSQGLFTHQMEDGSDPTERVLAKLKGQISSAVEILKFNSSDPRRSILELIVDDGVSSRGNRKNIFGDWDMIGCFTGPHQVSGHMTTFLFAQSASADSLDFYLSLINDQMVDPEGWSQKQQRVELLGNKLTVTNQYKMRDGSETIIGVTRTIVDGELV